jgi:acetyl-CoA carboxylase biotin carboxylase subunit
MIKKILIANRGEIALRIIRACKEMGIESVALYPGSVDPDQFLETKMADQAVCLGEDGILGYLDQRKIIQIAKRTGADAIHPGYGFLAENGDFADLCLKNRIKFIGPSPDALRKLGNKIEAKKIARKIGLPLLPGSEIAVKDEKELLKIAKEIRTPFLLKAANGGGGVGIEMIEKEDKKNLLEIFRKLKRETKNSFDSEEIFVEKFLKNPRHIEFQILGDGKGKVIHFGERECSIQRRNQKLIEEAPSPFLDKKMRKKMGKLAVKFGQYLKYESLGTVEFLVSEDKRFYFLEVNPRLQVEHPVTELVTGFDLVKEQIMIASGEKLKIKQGDIKFRGWAMEFRIYAEDASDDFRPHEGLITNYLAPSGKGVEVHSFCQPNQRVFPFFDSLLSKLVVFNDCRSGCIQRAKRAFEEYLIEGIPSLIPFYKVILENQKFLNGSFSTAFVEKEDLASKIKKRKTSPKIEDQKGDNEELARTVAYLYLARQKEDASHTNKWKMAERLKIFEE